MTKVPDWLEQEENPDGTVIIEGGFECGWVSWVGKVDDRETIALDGQFTLEQLRDLVAMMEDNEPPKST
jgi:hypothetical protein